ncbi:MAG: tyrosine-protein phosphatase [Pseudomonadota bacterium]
MERVFTLDGIKNFRDFGGYKSSFGGQVQAKRLYRSGALSSVTPTDDTFLRGLDIRQVFDLRGPDELERHPTNWTNPSTAFRHVPMPAGDMLAPGGLLDLIKRGDFDEAAAVAYMHKSYRKLIVEGAPAFKSFLEQLAGQETGAIVVHCMAGKDRTGIAVALAQLALGVAYEDVLEDYLLTNDRIDPDAQAENFRTRLMAIGFPEVPHPVMRPLSGVEVAYFETSMTAIDERYGSVEGYLSEGLGLPASTLEGLRRQFLEG